VRDEDDGSSQNAQAKASPDQENVQQIRSSDPAAAGPMSPLCGSRPAAETLALNTLMKEQKGRYQICGVNAFRIKQLLSRDDNRDQQRRLAG
jgi:hypothetical protein